MNDDVAEEVIFEDEEEDFPEILPLKWIADGSETLAEVAENLRAYAELLEGYERAGWQLSEPVDSGHCVFEHPTEKRLPSR